MCVDADAFYALSLCIFSAGRDFIVPTGARTKSPTTSKYLLSINEILDLFVDNRRDNNMPIVFILDCCRKEVESKKPPVDEAWAKAANIAILYSTAQEEEALDSHASSDHSPFTELLLQNIGKPGTIHDIDAATRKGFHEFSRLRERQVCFLLSTFIPSHGYLILQLLCSR